MRGLGAAFIIIGVFTWSQVVLASIIGNPERPPEQLTWHQTALYVLLMYVFPITGMVMLMV